MATKVLMEALSPTMEEGRVVNWLKHEGDAVNAGDILAEVETDKAVMELQARGAGVLRKVLAAEGATVPVGKMVAVIAAADEDVSDLVDGPASPAAPAPKKDDGKAKSAAAPTPAPAAAPGTSVKAPPSPAPEQGGRVRASPLARRVAEERGVNLAAVAGTGPGGRIIKRDLESAAAGAPERPSAAFTDVPLTQIRKTIARRLTQSIGPIPHFFLTTEIDMERVWEAREALNRIDGATRISFNDIVVKTVATALTQHPECNAWWQDDHIRYFRDVDLGMAVAIDDGLITPVIRRAQSRSLREIAELSKDLVERARARRLKPEEYTGSTFSVSNLGMFDIDQFTAVINPPEAGILAIGSISQQAVVHEGQLVARRRMRVTMSCDHRVIDGATGAKFLQSVKRMLENPLAMVW